MVLNRLDEIVRWAREVYAPRHGGSITPTAVLSSAAPRDSVIYTASHAPWRFPADDCGVPRIVVRCIRHTKPGTRSQVPEARYPKKEGR